MPGIFDIIGPVMIGPSSSHTAGAVRLGKMARIILGEQPVAAAIELHGSFAQTYRGHGTDKALAAGLLGYLPDDIRIRDSLETACQQGLAVSFTPVDLGDAHPNTAIIRLTGVSGKKVRIVGASVGGGNIVITKIDDFAVELTGEYHTLISIHQDKPGVVAMISSILAANNVNIAFMRVSRRQRGSQALAVIEADQPIAIECLQSIRTAPSIDTALMIPPL
ncbi:MAG: L-serine ammonia-lyase, iron-sulfur-dependent subunit beta [Negativicutes bacterium]|nr:L-serine ammonia-lyase, iron-sulfur-dependent subunit beta [Negativicutes bacterium]